MAAYKVTAPYVTLNVADANGKEVTLGYYEGAVVENAVEGEVLERHVRKGMVEKVSAPKAASASDKK